MTKGQIKDQLFKHLTPLLKDQGFIAKKSNDQFVRNTEFGFQAISFHIVMRTTNEIVFNFSVRFDAIEDLWVTVSDMEPKSMANSPTLICTQGNLSGGYPSAFPFNDPGELNTILDRFIRETLPLAEKFFEHYVDITSIDTLLNTDPNAELDLVHEEAHSIKGIISAHLANNKDFDSLKRSYQNRLSEYYAPFVDQKYIPLIETLKRPK